MRIKICGITNLEDAVTAANNGADALGFIFFKESPRYIEQMVAKSIVAALPTFVMKIGVFVNEPAESVNSTAQRVGLNAVQLHGDEDLNFIGKINLPVIKAFCIGDKFNFQSIVQYSDHALLLDSRDEFYYGGTGKTFDWGLIPPSLRNNIILAGGVSIDNIEFIFRTIKPQAVDVSSSIEISPGKKDRAKLIELLTKVKSLRGY